DAAVGASPRARRELSALYGGAAVVLVAARRAPANAVAKIAQLEARLAVAEHAVSADVARDWDTFAAGVEDELRSWRTYLERLHATVATGPPERRARVEAAIADVHVRRSAVYERLLQV